MIAIWSMRVWLCILTSSTLLMVSNALTINGSIEAKTRDYYNVKTFCDYFQRVETLLERAEGSGDPIHVAWIYGYFAAMFSSENDKLKQIIKSYMARETSVEESRRIFKCLKSFTNKLSLNKYINEHREFKQQFKQQYLGATEDIRSIMDSGVTSSFYMHSENESKDPKKRFIEIYKMRDSLSDPINKIFDLLSPKNCSARKCFLSDIFVWSGCDGSFVHFKETLEFFNSMQRFLMSSLFVEDLYLVLNSEQIYNSSAKQRYEDQLLQHRDQYQEISYGVIDGLRNCYQSLEKLKQEAYYAQAYRKTSSNITINRFLLVFFPFAMTWRIA